MKQTTFKILKMDCPSEEQMIRMKLEGITSIKKLDLDIPNRKLLVFHIGEASVFEQSIYDLKLDATLVDTISSNDEISEDNSDQLQKNALW